LVLIKTKISKSLQSYDFFCNFAPKLIKIMQKRIFFTILMAIFALSTYAEGLTYLSTEDFKKKVCYYDLSTGQSPTWLYLGDKPCLIDFYTSWCKWCDELHPILEQIAEQYNGQLYVYTLDAEKEPELAALFRVRSYPTVILCPMQGSPQGVSGYYPIEVWHEAIQEVFGITKP
jgi:thiol-disulfide isomerase/thioredoxin